MLNFNNKKGFLTITIYVLVFICIFFSIKSFTPAQPEPVVLKAKAPTIEKEEPIPQEPQEPEINIAPVYPTDKLFVSSERESYESTSMQIIIPVLEVDVPVLDGVDFETLKSGVGLYDYSQLPSHKANSNVSIAGHRDIYGCEFYYLDTVKEGDQIFLIYNGKKYTYDYVSTEIVTDDDWSPIYSKDFSAVTLTTCHPIGTSLKRMIVTGKLVKVEEV